MKSSAQSSDAASLRRVGRPSRVSAAQIAEAALNLGLDRATIRSVAEALGMSLAGLYHHVRTREELMSLAAAHAIRAMLLPDSKGKTWTAWVMEYSRHVFDTLVRHPEFIGNIVSGTTENLVHAQHLEKYLEVLRENGFTVNEAYETYVEMMSAVIGAAALEAGSRASAIAGRSLFGDLKSAADALDETTPLLRQLVNAGEARHPDRFEAVAVALAGVIDRRAGQAARTKKPTKFTPRRASRRRS
jgi:AcrR family transcriptional regulator